MFGLFGGGLFGGGGFGGGAFPGGGLFGGGGAPIAPAAPMLSAGPGLLSMPGAPTPPPGISAIQNAPAPLPAPASPGGFTMPQTYQGGPNTGMGLQDPIAQMTGVSDRDAQSYRNVLTSIESPKNPDGSPDYSGSSPSGTYAGRWQLGPDARIDASNQLGIPTPSKNEFLSNPALQDQMFEGYTAANNEYLSSNPNYASMTPQQKLAALGYAHNQGHGGAKNWLNTGQVGYDGNRTPGTAYSSRVANLVGENAWGPGSQMVATADTVPGVQVAQADPLQGIDPALANVYRTAEANYPGQFGIPTEADLAGVVPGRRTPEQQAAMVDRGWSQTYNSPHVDGRGLDIWPVNPETGKLDPNYTAGYGTIQQAMNEAGGMHEVPLGWGGDWTSFKDRPHWQVDPGTKGIQLASLPDRKPTMQSTDVVTAGVPGPSEFNPAGTPDRPLQSPLVQNAQASGAGSASAGLGQSADGQMQYQSPAQLSGESYGMPMDPEAGGIYGPAPAAGELQYQDPMTAPDRNPILGGTKIEQLTNPPRIGYQMPNGEFIQTEPMAPGPINPPMEPIPNWDPNNNPNVLNAAPDYMQPPGTRASNIMDQLGPGEMMGSTGYGQQVPMPDRKPPAMGPEEMMGATGYGQQVPMPDRKPSAMGPEETMGSTGYGQQVPMPDRKPPYGGFDIEPGIANGDPAQLQGLLSGNVKPTAETKASIGALSDAELASVAADRGLLPDRRPENNTYELKKGENPWAIAKRMGIPFAELMGLNQMTDAQSRRLPVGYRLTLPGGY